MKAIQAAAERALAQTNMVLTSVDHLVPAYIGENEVQRLHCPAGYNLAYTVSGTNVVCPNVDAQPSHAL